MIAFYDYPNQAWTRNGIYQDCGHPTTCNCYGRQHKGEEVSTESLIRAYERGVINYTEMKEIISLRKKEVV